MFTFDVVLLAAIRKLRDDMTMPNSGFYCVVSGVAHADVGDTKVLVQAQSVELGSFQSGIYMNSFEFTQLHWTETPTTGELTNVGDQTSTPVGITVVGYDTIDAPVDVVNLGADLTEIAPGVTNSFTR